MTDLIKLREELLKDIETCKLFQHAFDTSDNALWKRCKEAEARLWRNFHTNAQAICDALAELEKCRKGLAAIQSLIADSRGVVGLHLNGDVAPWDELRTGGRFEEWLLDFDDAMQQEGK